MFNTKVSTSGEMMAQGSSLEDLPHRLRGASWV